MTVLVTGGAGFVGSHIAEYYAKYGEEVVVFDTLSRAVILEADQKTALYNWIHLKENYSNIRLVKGDVREGNDVIKASREAKIIVHAAS